MGSGIYQMVQPEPPAVEPPPSEVASYDTSEARGTWEVPLRGLRVLSLARTADGETWFAGEEVDYPNTRRIGRVLGDTVEFVPFDDPGRNLRAVLVADPEGGVWFGQLYWDGSEWVDRSLPFAPDRMVVYYRFLVRHVANDGERWYVLQADCQGFGGGVYLVRDGILRHLRALFPSADEGFSSGNFVNVIAGRPNGEIWFGTGRDHCMQMDVEGGLTSFDGSAFRLQTVADGLAHPYVRDIAFGGDTVWVATDGGLTSFHGDAATIARSRGVSYTTVNSALPDNQVHAVAVDSTGAVWVGTEGASRFAGHWTHFDSTRGLPGRHVSDILVDPEDGRIWMATDQGIAILTHEPTPRIAVAPPATPPEEADDPYFETLLSKTRLWN
ncbi:two-component regulator propeller domain-containing protein, partial [Candidatus Latescibacterota bacterium]